MNIRVALLGSFTLSLLLTGCPLTDHYQLMSGEAGSPTAGADEAGAHAGGASPDRAGAGGANAGAPSGGDSPAGEAGEVAGSGAPNAGGGTQELGGAPQGGASMAGSGGAVAGGAGGGGAGGGGAGGAAGAPSGCGTTCTALQTCCASSCVDLSMDAANCGACGHACDAGRSCAAGKCKGGWLGVGALPMGFVARSRAASVAIGDRAFFWGGQDGAGNALDNGAIYNPADDSWKVLPKDTGSPSARIMASAVWTGSVVIVFGGTDSSGTTLYRDGSMYDPVANSWTALPANNNVSRRSAPYSFWDGTRAFFWGGQNAMGAGIAGADRFDLTNWSTSSTMGDPGSLAVPGVAFDGTTLYLMGGQLNGMRQDRVFAYSSTANIWTQLPKSGLSVRSSVFGAWDGTHFVVWGGRDDNGPLKDGRYLSGNTWTAVSALGAPSARMLAFRRSGWTFQISPGLIALVAGQVSTSQAATLTTDGATYNVALSQWTGIPGWGSGEAHEYGMGVWTGSEFVVWGGRNGNTVTLTGDRWAP